MIKAPISLQELRRKRYLKAKAEPSWRFWGRYVHAGKPEVLLEAYRLAKEHNGAAGIDGVTFEAIEANGTEGFIAQRHRELSERTHRPHRRQLKPGLLYIAESIGLAAGDQSIDPRR